jgi:hypothetical protein
MSGPGASGPLPKRTAERRRRNKVEGLTVTAPPLQPIEAPALDGDVHAIARAWYESLKTSGQARFYEPSDWAHAVYIATAMSRNLKSTKFSAVLFASVMSGMTDLLTTEGARRRARMEIERESGAPQQDPSVAVLSDYKRRLSG